MSLCMIYLLWICSTLTLPIIWPTIKIIFWQAYIVFDHLLSIIYYSSFFRQEMIMEQEEAKAKAMARMFFTSTISNYLLNKYLL